jgi:O-antigen/teichoic acid export membrane protein
MPMSFVTNVVLGRASSEALGMYSATQLLISGFQVFLVFGGSGVLARMVPGMGRDRRFPFLVSYCSLVVLCVSALSMIGLSLAPDLVRSLLARFGSPAPILVFVIGISVVVWSFGSHFLFAVERAPRASLLIKALVIGYFGFALICLMPFGREFLLDPATSLWNATALICLMAAVATVGALAGLPELREWRAPLWHLPGGFWSSVTYIHLSTLVDFAYTSLVPTLVLWWYDVESLGRLSASLRWVALLAVLPATFGWVLTPGFSKLDAAGLRDDALRLAASTLRSCSLLLVPAVLALVLFAPDFLGVFGRDYRAFAGLLSVVGLSVLAVPVVQIGGGMIVAFGELRIYVAASIVNVVACLLIGLTLVPQWGLNGAAWALLSSAAFQTFVVAWVLRRRIGLEIPSETWLGWGFGIAAVAAALWFAPGRLSAFVLWVALCAGFARSARVTLAEIRGLVRRFLWAGR